MGSAHPEHARRLVEWIYRDDNLFLITFDNYIAAQNFKESGVHRDNVDVRITSPVVWGGMSMIYSTLDAIRAVLSYGQEWRYFIPLSDTDIPLKDQQHIISWLNVKSGNGAYVSMHINDWDLPSNFWIPEIDCNLCYSFERQLDVRSDVKFMVHPQLSENFNILKNSPIYNVDKRQRYHVTENREDKSLYIRPMERSEIEFRRAVFSRHPPKCGKFWCAISRSACEWLMGWPELPSLTEAFSSTFIPDESFLHTAFNSPDFPWPQSIDRKNPVRWNHGAAQSLADKHLSDLQSTTALFARKLDNLSAAPSLIDWVERFVSMPS
jgi:hypothetical protein